MRARVRLFGFSLLLLLTAHLSSNIAPAAEVIEATVYSVGVAAQDITPAYPVRLSGFGFRRTESEGVTQAIWAKALAIDGDGEGPAILITVDNLGVPRDMVAELAVRLRGAVRPERLAVTATHTHTAPMLRGVAPTLFGLPIPASHQEHVDRYSRELLDHLEMVSRKALADRRPARMQWGIGSATFAQNRRTRGGPVDHDLPLMVVRDLKGNIRALYVSYACHCVTLSNNRISGDWAGYAQELIERKHTGAIALVSVGCGADSNPSSGVTKDNLQAAAAQGSEIAREVDRLLAGYLAPISGKIRAHMDQVKLPFDALPTRKQWEERAKRGGAIGYHAQVQIARLDRGQHLQTELDYSVQSWAFGDGLAMVFLPGEVVVDYSNRLKRELDPGRVWINAYANDDPCYIPSERILKEGGYEGGDAMIYYDRPTRLRSGLEQRIVDVVRSQLMPTFQAPFDATRVQGTRPLSPQQSAATLRTSGDMTAELVAAEPLVVDPVAIAFGPDGRLWVAEMGDYPRGLDGRLKPGGRIKVLEDTDGDGRYDKASVFLENIPFPTGITVWRNGVLVCAAPDILFAEDTKGTGKADRARKLYTGFATHNYQARVNSLEYGLDNWVYGSGGIFGGDIRSFAGDKVHHLANRDFRIRPDTGEIEAAAGRTQQGRVRDDWGNWFGCDNSVLVRHYPLAEQFQRRNPHLPLGANEVYVPDYPESTLLYPLKNNVQLFKLSGPPRRVTSACGLGIYRDDLLGDAFKGNTFTCEPVNLLVHRLVLQPRGLTFSGRRAPEEQHSDFLAGADNWFRPVQMRTGPDGALWVVDMYRLVIEHPQWIPPEDLAQLDVRAGHTAGRIYRVYPRDKRPRPIVRLDRLDGAGLVAALDSPNGAQRDLAQQMLVWKQDRSAVIALENAASSAARAETRLQALCTLDGLNALRPEDVRQAMADSHPGVRRHAVHLAEKWVRSEPTIAEFLLKLLDDPDPQVLLQLAYTLGEWHDPRAGKALAVLALRGPDDPYLLAGILSSANPHNLGAMLAEVLTGKSASSARHKLTATLIGMATAFGNREVLQQTIATVFPPMSQAPYDSWQFDALAAVLDALERRREQLDRTIAKPQLLQLEAIVDNARHRCIDAKESDGVRIAALNLLGRQSPRLREDISLLAEAIAPQNPLAVQGAAIARLGKLNGDQIASEIMRRWRSASPASRSQILDVLLSRPVWLGQLLSGLEAGSIPVSEIDAVRRALILRIEDPTVRRRAEKLFAGARNQDRKQVLRDYQGVLTLPSDRVRGKTIFATRCAICHQLEGVGHAVGPDLAGMANKSAEVLLIAILDPNQAVDNRYVEYVAATKDGRIHTGVLAAETSTGILLREKEGKEQTILRSELEELHSTGKSLMPEGLEKDFSKQDLADVIGYVKGIGPPVKSAGK